MVILLGQDGQLTSLLILEALQNGLVVGFGRVLQQVVPQGLVLPRLDLTSVLELPLNLELFGLKRDKRNGAAEQTPTCKSSMSQTKHSHITLCQ